MGYFIFNGTDSREFGVTAKMAFPPVAERVFTTAEIPGRSEPLNRLEVMRKNSKLAFTVSVLDLSRLAEINAWLQGKGDLILSSDPSKKYHAYVNQGITPERLAKLYCNIPIVFTVEPFRYTVNDYPIVYDFSLDYSNNTHEFEVELNGTADSEPVINFKLAGDLTMTVNGREFRIETPGNYTNEYIAEDWGSLYIYRYTTWNVVIDSARRIVYKKDSGVPNTVILDKTIGILPGFSPGKNKIKLSLDKSNFLHNSKKYKRENISLSGFNCIRNERWY